jgi:BirA family biotin operon repressor/biotin-[acetyl-CoA-carboxylase] ligase
LAAARAPLLTLAAGLGIGRTLRELGMEELIIKWPNDLTVGKKKLGGILTEMVHQKEKVDFVVIGVGLNVETEAADLSPETAPLATSLKQVQDRTWDKGEILERVLGALLDEVQRLVDRGPAELVGRWEQESGMVGHRIRVLRENGDVEGTVLGLRDDGQLKIETAEGGLLHLLAEDTVLCS